MPGILSSFLKKCFLGDWLDGKMGRSVRLRCRLHEDMIEVICPWMMAQGMTYKFKVDKVKVKCLTEMLFLYY